MERRDPGAAPPVFQPPPGNPRFPLLDAMRAIAVLCIVVLHAALFSEANLNPTYGRFLARLDVGVTVFFVISGFLLYRPYVADRLGGGRAPALSTYARNRFLRIVPAYWAAMTVLALTIELPGFWTGHTWSYYLFAQEADLGWSRGGILPTWSLTVEASFYVVLPLLAWLAARIARGRPRAAQLRSEAALVAALVLVAVVYRVLVRADIGDDPTSNVWAFLPASVDWFALGMGLAVVSAALDGSAVRPRVIRLIERRPEVAWLAALALFVLVSAGIGLEGRFPEPTSSLQWVVQQELYGLVALALVLPAVFGGERGGVVRSVLRWPPLVWLGLVSYGLFLYHHPILLELRDVDLWESFPFLGLLVAGLSISTACAAASYYIVERPLLRLKRTRQSAGVAAPAPARS
jgi:peptidoglycan/LPS O-acetylase OafA/YrhL